MTDCWRALRCAVEIALGVVGLYVVACLAMGLMLGHLSLRLPKRVVRNEVEVRARWEENFGAVPRDVQVEAADHSTLHAWYAKPSASSGRSVILLHGIGGNREDMSGFADMFLKHGYAVLLPDSRAHGDSGGEFATYGITERDDVRRWVAWVRQREPGCTYLLGESMGAAIGLQATEVAPQLCAVAVEDPYAHFLELAPERMGYMTHTSTRFWRTLAKPVITTAIVYARVRYRLWLPEADPMQAVEHSRVPTLLISGTRDLNIPMHHAQELEQACASHCMLWVVKGADHGGASSVAGTEFDRRILSWFAAHDSIGPAKRSS